MAGEYIFTIEKLTKRVNQKPIIENIFLSFFPGAKIGVIGSNGAGKSTLMRIMAGVDSDYEGKAEPAKGTKIGYVPQEPQLDESLTVRENVRSGAKEIVGLLEEFEAINAQMADPELDPDDMMQLLDKLGPLQDKLDTLEAWELDQRIEKLATQLNLPPLDQPVTHLSGGEKRRVALSRVLMEQPDLLLLDEPTNHLDAASVAWLQESLQNFPGTVVFITHDRYFLDQVAEWILEMDKGRGYPWKGNYSSWLEQKEKQVAQQEKRETALKKRLKKELEWVRLSQGDKRNHTKARIKSYEKLVKQSKSQEVQEKELHIPPGSDLGQQVVEFNNVTKTFGDRTLFEDLTFSLPRGGIIGITGPNGAGKTTLFKLIAGTEEPDQGDIAIGSTVDLAYVDQDRSSLNDERPVWQEISDGEEEVVLGDKKLNARAYAARFNFSGQDSQKKVGLLSGGERNRVHLAKTIRSGGNLLLLDEPSNDLDVDTLLALEQAIEQFPGCAVVISHDRWFLDRICTHTLNFDGDGNVEFFHGPYSEYAEHVANR